MAGFLPNASKPVKIGGSFETVLLAPVVNSKAAGLPFQNELFPLFLSEMHLGFGYVVHEWITSLGRVGLISPKTSVQKVQGNYLMDELNYIGSILLDAYAIKWLSQENIQSLLF